MKFLITALLAMLLAACATPYQPSGMSGGFTETRLDSNVFRVTFKGNGYTSRERAEDMALLRSAELTLQYGFTHFAIADGRSTAEHVTIDMPTRATTTGTVSTYGNTSYINARTNVTGGDSFTVAKPSTTNTIVCFNGKPQINAFVYDANFLVDSLSPKYKPK